MLKQIELGSKNCKKEVLKNIIEYPIMLQLPSVYSIIALPTSKGVDELNEIKDRLPEKNYGSIIGSFNNFFSLINPNNLPEKFQNINSFMPFSDCFIRAYLEATDKNTPVIKNGTHQALLIKNKTIRSLITTIENYYSTLYEKELFAGKKYIAPLCTSANISGDSKGSIVNKKKAIDFANERNIKLIITLNNKDISSDLGSYPIISFNKNKIDLIRKGPGDQKIISLIPDDLRGINFF